MKCIEVVIELNGVLVSFNVTANTEFDARQLVKGKLIDSLTKAKVSAKGLA
jgi:hypothetical protein